MQTINKPSKKTVLYARFNGLTKLGTPSIDSQLKEAKEFSYSHGLKLDKIFIDNFDYNYSPFGYRIKDRAVCKTRKNYPIGRLLMPELVPIRGEGGRVSKKGSAFNEMLSYICDHPVNVLLTTRLERLFGNLEDLRCFVDNVLEPRGIAIQSINENFNSQSSEGRQFFHMLDSFGEFDCKHSANKFWN